MRIVSANLNGIRSARDKGFFEWLIGSGADVCCVQEIKAQDADIGDDLRRPTGYVSVFHAAEKKGYSGVGIYSRREPDRDGGTSRRGRDGAAGRRHRHLRIRRHRRGGGAVRHAGGRLMRFRAGRPGVSWSRRGDAAIKTGPWPGSGAVARTAVCEGER
jgi:hypothetical protein